MSCNLPERYMMYLVVTDEHGFVTHNGPFKPLQFVDDANVFLDRDWGFIKTVLDDVLYSMVPGGGDDHKQQSILSIVQKLLPRKPTPESTKVVSKMGGYDPDEPYTVIVDTGPMTSLDIVKQTYSGGAKKTVTVEPEYGNVGGIIPVGEQRLVIHMSIRHDEMESFFVDLYAIRVQ